MLYSGLKCPSCPRSFRTRGGFHSHLRVHRGLKQGSGERLFSTSDAQMERIKEHIIQPYEEKDFYPVLLYRQAVINALGRAKAVYNYFCAAMEMELPSVFTMASLTQEHGYTSELAHLTGFHANYGIGYPTFNRWGTRFLAHPELTSRTPHLREYLEFLRGDGGLELMPLHPISRWTSHPSGRYGQMAWRYKPRSRVEVIPLPEVWPFIPEKTPRGLDGMEMLLAVDAVVPKSLPEQMREDLCQDLVMALLSGEVEQRNLRDALPAYIQKVKRLFPIKYGNLSLSRDLFGDGRTLEGKIHSSLYTIETLICQRCERVSDEGLYAGLCSGCQILVERQEQLDATRVQGWLDRPPRHNRFGLSDIQSLTDDDDWDSPTAGNITIKGRMRKKEKEPTKLILGPELFRSQKRSRGATMLTPVPGKHDYHYKQADPRSLHPKGDELTAKEVETLLNS